MSPLSIGSEKPVHQSISIGACETSALFAAEKSSLVAGEFGASGAGGTVAQLTSTSAASVPDVRELMARMLLQIMQVDRKSVGNTPQSAFSVRIAAFRGMMLSAHFGTETSPSFEDRAKQSNLNV